MQMPPIKPCQVLLAFALLVAAKPINSSETYAANKELIYSLGAIRCAFRPRGYIYPEVRAYHDSISNTLTYEFKDQDEKSHFMTVDSSDASELMRILKAVDFSKMNFDKSYYASIMKRAKLNGGMFVTRTDGCTERLFIKLHNDTLLFLESNLKWKIEQASDYDIQMRSIRNLNDAIQRIGEKEEALCRAKKENANN